MFEGFAFPLIGLPASYASRGYGSAIALEFGALTHSAWVGRDGSLRNPSDAGLPDGGNSSRGHAEIGRLPEINVALSSGVQVTLDSYATSGFVSAAYR